jgi:putative transposase
MQSVSDVRPQVQEAIWHRLRHQAGHMLTRFCQALMEAERDTFLDCRPHERSAHRRGYRNGYEGRSLETVFGVLRLRVPRVRDTERALRTLLFDAYRRRSRDVEVAVEAWVAAGCSTRAVVDAMSEAFGYAVSPATISRIVAQIDAELAAWRLRPLERSYRVLWLDAKHGYVRKRPGRRRKRRRRGRRQKAVLLVAWGLRHDGREELVDFQAVQGTETYETWAAFLTRLWERGVVPRNRWDEPLEMIVTDGDAGLEGACDLVWPTVPRQRCVFHKLQNVGRRLRDRSLRGAVLATASALWDGVQTAAEASRRLQGWSQRWRPVEPEAVETLVDGFDQTLRYLNLAPALRRRVRTTNPIERVMKEIEQATDHVPIWEHTRSWERHLWILWKRLKHRGYRPTRPRPEFTRTS